MEKRIMMFKGFVFVLLVAALALAGCSDGGGGGAAPVQKAPAKGVSTGVITQLGSIFVNGVEFDTSSAAINMEDSSDLPILKVGMVVTVNATFTGSTHGKATSVKFADNLKGPIAAFNSTAGIMTVLGQNIKFDSATVFDDFPTTGTGGVVAGQMVQVSGFRDPAGTLQATRIERHLPDWTQNTIVELKGTITSRVPGSSQFSIGGLMVDATGLSLPTNIVVGSYVKVEGRLAMFTGMTLTATNVSSYKESFEDEGAESQRVELEGFVKNLSGNTFMIGGTLVNARSLSLAGIANGVKVEVKGTLSNGVLMASSIQIESAVPPTTVPTAPVVSAVAGFGQVTLSWNGVSGATSYNIYWSTTTGVTPATGTKIPGAISPYVQTGLTAVTTYFYVVTAVNSVGEGAPSAQVQATTLSAQTIPAAPIGVSAVGGVNQATITWAAVAGATSYNIYWSPTTGVTPATGTQIANVTSSYVQTGLTAATTYFYVVTAVNAAGESAPSAQVSAITASAAVPPAPTGLTATGGAAQVALAWNAVAGATSYNIYWSTTTGVTPLTGTLLANTTAVSFVQTGLAASTTYFYVVTALNAAGESLPSSEASGTTTASAMPPAMPTGVTAVGGTNLVTVSWPAVSGATSYNLYWSTITGVTPATGTLIANVTSPFMHTGLAASTTYFYVLTAINAAGTSAPSTQVSAATAAPALDGAALYATNCAGCHNPLVSSNVRGRTAAQIQSAIDTNFGGMGFLSVLTPAQVQAIATALNF